MSRVVNAEDTWHTMEVTEIVIVHVTHVAPATLVVVAP